MSLRLNFNNFSTIKTEWLNLYCICVAGASSVRTSENFDSERETDATLNELLNHIKVTQLHKDGYDDLLFQNDHETFEKVKSIQYRRAADRKNQSIVPLL